MVEQWLSHTRGTESLVAAHSTRLLSQQSQPGTKEVFEDDPIGRPGDSTTLDLGDLPDTKIHPGSIHQLIGGHQHIYTTGLPGLAP